MNEVILRMVRDEAVRIKDAQLNLAEQLEHMQQLLALIEQPELPATVEPLNPVPPADSAKITNPTVMNLALGSLVATVRESLGWSRAVFGAHLGLKAKTIMEAELGICRLAPKIMVLIQALAPADIKPGLEQLLQELAGNQDLPLESKAEGGNKAEGERLKAEGNADCGLRNAEKPPGSAGVPTGSPSADSADDVCLCGHIRTDHSAIAPKAYCLVARCQCQGFNPPAPGQQ